MLMFSVSVRYTSPEQDINIVRIAGSLKVFVSSLAHAILPTLVNPYVKKHLYNI